MGASKNFLRAKSLSDDAREQTDGQSTYGRSPTNPHGSQIVHKLSAAFPQSRFLRVGEVVVSKPWTLFLRPEKKNFFRTRGV